MSYNYLFKYIIIGDTSVGKSSILLKFTDDRFSDIHDFTIGVEYGSKYIDINNRKIKLQIWDTAGQEIFRSISRSYYRGTAGVLLVYDITNKKTFENLELWLTELYSFTNKEVVVMLIGNKNDLENEREVSFYEAKSFAEKNNLYFIETSAKNNTNIKTIFHNTAERIYENIQEEKYDLITESCGIKIGIKELEIELDRDINNKNKCNC